jgi:hypothetical protein
VRAKPFFNSTPISKHTEGNRKKMWVATDFSSWPYLQPLRRGLWEAKDLPQWHFQQKMFQHKTRIIYFLEEFSGTGRSDQLTPVVWRHMWSWLPDEGSPGGVLEYDFLHNGKKAGKYCKWVTKRDLCHQNVAFTV